LQQTLSIIADTSKELPEGFILSDQSPGENFFSGARRILFLLGPGIGIGDEIMLFRVPSWIKTQYPQTEITVLSAYKELWDRVNNIDDVFYYNDYLSILKALRGEEPFKKFDVVILADFEKANLCETVCFETSIDRYVEISTGTYSAAAVDNRNNWIYRVPRQIPYFPNYYFGLNQLLQWLGITPGSIEQFSTVLRHRKERPGDRLRIFVSPFTSKYEPSESYWSHLLATLCTNREPRKIDIVLDPGPNKTTGRFANKLKRSVKARIPVSIGIETAYSEGLQTLVLGDVFREMEKSHAVICADSFAAHAAPLFGCTTLVIASSDLINWRVPYDSSYYFRAEDPVKSVAIGMQYILNSIGGDGSEAEVHWHMSDPWKQIREAAKELQNQVNLGPTVNIDTLSNVYFEFVSAYKINIDRLKQWLPDFFGLFCDFPYNKPINQLKKESFQGDEFKPDLLRHLQAHLDRWKNTNLRKYLDNVINKADWPIENKR
jgi:ADP-heptose:LPS heptosyltransferase